MKKFLGILFVMFFVFGVAGMANADTLTDITGFTSTGTTPGGDLNSYGWGDVNKLDGITDYVRWTHHFTFTPPAEEVVSGTLTLSLRDDKERWWIPEFAFGVGEDFTWDFGEVNTGDYSYNVNGSSLMDGTYQITLISMGGDFYIDQSELVIDYNPVSSAPVPEPATMFLLGSGLLGLAGFGRKKSIKNA